jgi:hypothetical protein
MTVITLLSPFLHHDTRIVTRSFRWSGGKIVAGLARRRRPGGHRRDGAGRSLLRGARADVRAAALGDRARGTTAVTGYSSRDFRKWLADEGTSGPVPEPTASTMPG